jgi:inositol-phosphate transport system permease protein
MTTVTTVNPMVEQPRPLPVSYVVRAVRSGLLTLLVIGGLAFFLKLVLYPLIASVRVEENLTLTLGDILLFLAPFLTYIACGVSARGLAKNSPALAILSALVAVTLMYFVVIASQSILGIGAFTPKSSLQMTLRPTAEGIIVDSVTPGGAAEAAGFQVGDLITGIRRDPVTYDQLMTQVAQSNVDDPIRLRFVRNGEEMQETVRVALAPGVETTSLLTGYGVALALSIVAIFWIAHWTPYVLLLLSLLPMIVGYAWLIIATLSYRTNGLLPVGPDGNIGGFTLENWSFLTDPRLRVWSVTLNSLVVALVMVVLVVTISAMAGYALARMNFRGRRTFLSFTLTLHGFPAVTLLISIFFVLNFISKLPFLGGLFGYNTLGGIALVMVAFELPLGIWLMKGFFDNISWDMERSALIDGASRWRTFWEIILPQIRPGILSLGIFAFISGWNAYLIPITYSVGANTVTLSVFLRQFIDDTAPVNWNMVAAAGLFQLIPVFIFFVFAQEYLLNIYAGGLKGSS